MNQENEILSNIAKYIAKKIVDEKNNNISKLIIEGGTLLASVAALIGAGVSLFTSYSSLEIQKEINNRQIRLNENDYVNSLYFHRKKLGYPNLTCTTIPIDDNNSWEKYHQCLFDLKISDVDTLSFKGATLEKRAKCMINVLKLCATGDAK